MLAGVFGPLGRTSQSTLVGASVLVIVPSLMVAACTLLPVRVCRAANIALGILYTLVMLAVIPGAWYYYKTFAVMEIALSLSIVWLAYKWPAGESGRALRVST
jgi:hypothetical protein